MNTETPQGATPPGPTTPSADRRVTDLIHEAMSLGRRFGRAVADSLRTLAVANQQPGQAGHAGLVLGVILHAIPHLNWYKVQLGPAGFVRCCALQHASGIPLGVRHGAALPPGCQVLVFKPRHLTTGIILGVIPPALQTNAIARPDWLVQGGQSGIKRETAHKYPIKSLATEGGVRDFSAGAPVDATSLETNQVSGLTGLGLLIDDWQACLRVNEMCGLFISYFDGHTRLAGRALDIHSLVHEETTRLDEGEARRVHRVSLYPWEGLGCYEPGRPVAATQAADAVQYRRPVAALDLPEGDEDVRGIWRYQEYQGYLGQGSLRLVAAPKELAGRNRPASAADVGLFCEAVSAAGDVVYRTAKSLLLLKRVNLVVPKELKDPEDGDGDDAELNNYKFSSQYGGGEEHKIGDVKLREDDADSKSMVRIAAARDLLAHLVNWKVPHPFHYHKKDYRVPQEAEASGGRFDRVSDHLDFAAVSSKPYMRHPEPVTLKIDHRYGDVDFFQREAFLYFADDGAVHLGCGYGAEITLAGGKLRLACPGDLELLAGHNLLGFGRDVVLQGHNSVDLDAQKDLRASCGKNMQLVAGHLLVEATNPTTDYRYRNKIGEDVEGGGVVIRAPGNFVVLAGEVYVRTGGTPGGGKGDITLDANDFAGDVTLAAKSVYSFVDKEMTIWHGKETPKETHAFAADYVLLSGNLV